MSKSLTIEELSQKVDLISKYYFLARKVMNSVGDAKNESYKDHPFFKFIILVQLSYKSLPKDQKQVINNDFFFQAYPSWWENIYKYDAYRRLKEESLKAFLKGIYHEN